MGVMANQPPLPMAPAGAVPIGEAAALLEDGDGERVFLRGELVYAWAGGDAVLRRLAALRPASQAFRLALDHGLPTPRRRHRRHCRVVVPITWERTVPGQDAVWVKGMFANENSACKLRNKFTLDELESAFKLDAE